MITGVSQELPGLVQKLARSGGTSKVISNEIETEFGPVVSALVEGLTDVSRPEDGNRRTRKSIDRDRLAEQSGEVQTIKLADLIHNTYSIEEHDPSFYKVYKREKMDLLTVLTKGDLTLMWRAQQQIGGQ